MSNGGFGRGLGAAIASVMLLATGAAAAMGSAAPMVRTAVNPVPNAPLKRGGGGSRYRWTYARKDHQTMAQQKRAARKKRNRARHK